MKIKLYFFHEQWVFEKEGKIVPWHIKVDDELTGNRIRVFLCEHEVDVPDVVPLPEIEIKQIMVSGMRQEIKDIQADTHMKVKQIEERIQQLLCLENKEVK